MSSSSSSSTSGDSRSLTLIGDYLESEIRSKPELKEQLQEINGYVQKKSVDTEHTHGTEVVFDAMYDRTMGRSELEENLGRIFQSPYKIFTRRTMRRRFIRMEKGGH